MQKFHYFLNNAFLNKFFSSNKIINPRRDWIILIVLFLIMIISAIIFDASFYTKISNGDMYVSVSREELNLENLKTGDLKKLIEDFESKKEIISNLKIKYLIDPSL